MKSTSSKQSRSSSLTDKYKNPPPCIQISSCDPHEEVNVKNTMTSSHKQEIKPTDMNRNKNRGSKFLGGRIKFRKGRLQTSPDDSIPSTENRRSNTSSGIQTSYLEYGGEVMNLKSLIIDEEKAYRHQQHSSNGVFVFEEETTRSSSQSIRSRTLSDNDLVLEFSQLMSLFPTNDPLATPLHLACSQHNNHTNNSSLHNYSSREIEPEEQHQQEPLVFSDELILNHLLKSNPKAISTSNSNGDLPLHCLVSNPYGCSEFLLNSLIQAYPESVRHANHDDCLPIHLVCRIGVPHLHVLDRLLKEYPLSIMIQSNLSMPYNHQENKIINNHMSIKDTFDSSYDSPPVESDGICCFMPFLTRALSLSPSPSMDSTSNNNNNNNNDILTDDPTIETGYAPLHFASIHGAPPDAIELLIRTRPDCLHIQTNRGRTALSCAKSCIVNVLNASEDEDDSILPVKPIFAAVEVLQSEMKNYRKVLALKETSQKVLVQLKSNRKNDTDYGDTVRNLDSESDDDYNDSEEVKAQNQKDEKKDESDPKSKTVTFQRTRPLSRQIISPPTETIPISTFDAKHEWQLLSNAFKFINTKIGVSSGPLSPSSSMLGPMVYMDSLAIIPPEGYTLPTNFPYICVDIDLPVGFHRLRWALLNSQSRFLEDCLLVGKLKYSEITILPWDNYDDYIGSTPGNRIANATDDAVDDTFFIGASKKIFYRIPRSGLVASNMAHEQISIIEYNDYCFAVLRVTKTPEVPYGDSFETHTKTVIINKGRNRCQMVASVQEKFLGKEPMIAWKIKNAIHSATTDFYVHYGTAICENANE